MAIAETERATVRVLNIPQTIVAAELLCFFESCLGPDSVFAVEIPTDHNNWKPRGYGRVQFNSLDAKNQALLLSSQNKLLFKSQNLKISESFDDIIPRPVDARKKTDASNLHVGIPGTEERRLFVMETWEGVRFWVMPERKRAEIWVWQKSECYKIEIRFEDIVEAVGCCVNDAIEVNALLLKLKFGPKIYQKFSGPNMASKFKPDRYHICKEDHDFLWVRTTDFSSLKSIGQSSRICLEIMEGLEASEAFPCFPFYREDKVGLTLENGKMLSYASEVVPLINPESCSKLPYKILYQINSLVHTHKISFASASDIGFIDVFYSLSLDTALAVLKKLHQQSSFCYNPLSFIKSQLHTVQTNMKNPPSLSHKRLTEKNIMSCHRAYITPSKIYLLGPELETSNYIVSRFAEYASDFMRVTFVEEDWSKLPATAVSTTIKRGVFVKPYRTKIYHRILSILNDGIVVGSKRFEFLAFSASQLRGSSVWMFASNEKVKAKDIREWMGSFNKIRNVSKCAARMGQLFSSSRQTIEVEPQDLELISDIEVTSNGVSYCFSDGIGKISPTFARQVAQMCGLSDTPSAFQIRFGGYKGVLAVDQKSVTKMSLRGSMLKFESKNRMLNITRWSESMPCFLNREIICLLSTLGIEDKVFEVMQKMHLILLGKMMEDRESALDVLQKQTGGNLKNILVKMLLQGYQPKSEPYLSMMLRVHHESQLSELKSRCRIFVPKGRILIGCLDEMGILDYGQVYVRLTLTKAELECRDQTFFRKVDEKTSVIVGKLVVTKNPCLHPGDIRVLEAVYEIALEENKLIDCLVFPQKGERPHPNECSGGDLDGDQFFISWDENLIPRQTDPPMDYSGSRPRIMDHEVTLEEIQKFFVDYIINDTLGTISTAHIVHSDCEPEKARSEKCLQLATLHSMAVDFAKTGAPAEMPYALKPKQYPDFLERFEKTTYTSEGVFGKLYRAVKCSLPWQEDSTIEPSTEIYDQELEVDSFQDVLGVAEIHREMYAEKLRELMRYYGAVSEDEILTGILKRKESYLQRDNRRYGDMKDRILLAVKNLQSEAKEWFEKSCEGTEEEQRLASGWYHVTYHPSYRRERLNFLSFPWIVGDILMEIKSINKNMRISLLGG